MKPFFQPACWCSFLCLFLAAGGCSEKKEERVVAVPPVLIFTLPEADGAPFRSFPGEVTAQDNVRLSFDVAGRLVDFPVYDGKVVAQGELIGQLEQGDFRAALDAAQATFNTAQQEFERNRTLRQRNVIAQNEFDRHREAFERADAALRTARKAFEDTRLFAPIKGRVSQRFVRNFQNVQAREPVVLLQNIETLDVDVQVPEAVMASVRRGTTAAQAHDLVEASVEFAAVPGERFPLTLRSFATQANPSSRTFLVSFRFRPPEDRNILPGMTCTVFLRFRHADGTPVVPAGLFQIPVRALATAEGKAFVWRWDAATGRVARVPVEMGTLTGETIQVRSDDLKAGDELVSSGVRFLSEGMTVQRLETRKP
jgi:multidrug efflux system membrane fusion protein